MTVIVGAGSTHIQRRAVTPQAVPDIILIHVPCIAVVGTGVRYVETVAVRHDRDRMIHPVAADFILRTYIVNVYAARRVGLADEGSYTYRYEPKER